MKKNTNEKSLVKVNENGIFYKIKQFFKNLFISLCVKIKLSPLKLSSFVAYSIAYSSFIFIIGFEFSCIRVPKKSIHLFKNDCAIKSTIPEPQIPLGFLLLIVV